MGDKVKRPQKEKRLREKLNHTSGTLKERLAEAYKIVQDRIKKSVRLEILWMVAIAFALSSVTFFSVSRILNATVGRYSYTSCEANKQIAEDEFLNTVKSLNTLQGDMGQFINPDEIYSMLQEDEAYSITELKKYLIELTDDKITFNSKEAENAATVAQLYKELKKQKDINEWEDQTVRNTVIEYLQQNNVDMQSLILAKAQQQIDSLRSRFDNYSQNAEIYLVDSTGQLIYGKGYIEKLDLVKIIQSVNTRDNNGENDYKAIYPVIINGQVYYIFAKAALEAQVYYGYTNDIGNILGFMAAVGIFILLLTRLTKDKIAYIEYLSSCLSEISKGDLSYKIEVVGEDELAQVARNITTMEYELQAQIEAQMKAEKAKNELVTNVAHDLRTPLTSIIGYIGLVKDKRYENEEEQDKYLNIAYDKAEKLKVIIEDLFELTKLHQDSVQLNKEVISISSLLNQLVEEMLPLADEKNIEVQTYIEPTVAEAAVDVAKMTRVFENLIENAIKYSRPGNAIYIELKEFSKQVHIAVSNHYENIPQDEVEKFFQRFYRADQSRNSQVGGSGLGLAIAKNIVELHGGRISAKITGDLISFIVKLNKEEIIINRG